MSASILLVEDEDEASDLVYDALRSLDSTALTRARTLAEGWKYVQALRPNLVILDVGLPDGSGVELCRQIRQHPVFGAMPIILLTAREKFQDKAGGFEAGADHYLVKPFQIKELRLWVQALLRRVNYQDKDGGILRLPDFAIDPQARSVEAEGMSIRNLTPKEFDLLYELVRRSPKLVSKDTLLKEVWGEVVRDNTIEVHVKNLRAKLGPVARRLATVPAFGYRFS